jgi:hypothetical protein
MRTDAKHIILFSIVAAAIAGVLFFRPIPQDPAYHVFADQRAMLAIPNFWNVVTNVPFIIVGTMGVVLVALREMAGGLPELRKEYFIFFLGVCATGLGSAYYHYHPTNDTLLWDRIPIAVTIVAFFSAVVGEYISAATSRRLFWPLIALGIGSVLYWYLTEKSGSGDLRLYALVQYLPVLLFPVILVLFKARLVPAWYLWAVAGSYPAAKIAEMLDGPIYAAGCLLSGHSLKHLVAALGTYLFYIALRSRKVD